MLVGDGNLKSAVIRLAEQLQVHHRIKFLEGGYDIESIFNIADFCVLSSIRDGGTLYVNLEAASLSKPHIATNVGGIPEFIIHEKTGLLVEPQEPEHLAEEMKRFLADPAFVNRLGFNANKLFCERHSYDQFINETVDVYKQMLV
jgi:glycosyltransferase involved in cell wall biosynthesis